MFKRGWTDVDDHVALDRLLKSLRRMQGEHKGGTYWAEEIVIWEAASKPPM